MYKSEHSAEEKTHGASSFEEEEDNLQEVTGEGRKDVTSQKVPERYSTLEKRSLKCTWLKNVFDNSAQRMREAT